MTLASGSVLSLLLPLIAAPFLTRLFSPETFGVFGLGSAVAALLTPLATGTYEHAVVAAGDDETAAGIVRASRRLTLVIALAACIGALGAAAVGWIPPELGWFVPLAALLGGWNILLSAWSNRRAAFGALARARLGQSVVATACSVGFGWAGMTRSGLLLANLLGLSASLVFVAQTLPAGLGAGGGWRALRADIGFPRWTLPSTWVNTLAVQWPVWLLQHFHGREAVGYFALANRVVGAPVSVVSSSLGEVFRQRAAFELRGAGGCAPLLFSHLRGLAAAAILPCVVLAWQGERLFGFVFGQQWTTAGAIAAAMTLVVFCRVAISPLTVVVLLRKAQRLDFGLQVAMLLSGLAGALAGALGGSVTEIIGWWAAGQAVVYGAYLFVSSKLAAARAP